MYILNTHFTHHSYYTWSESCVSTDQGVPCMRMLWNNAPDKVAAFKKATANGPSGGKNIILGFNEYVS